MESSKTSSESYAVAFDPTTFEFNQTFIASHGVGPAYLFPQPTTKPTQWLQSSGQYNTCFSFGENCAVYCSSSYNCFNDHCDTDGQCQCDRGFISMKTLLAKSLIMTGWIILFVLIARTIRTLQVVFIRRPSLRFLSLPPAQHLKLLPIPIPALPRQITHKFLAANMHTVQYLLLIMLRVIDFGCPQ